MKNRNTGEFIDNINWWFWNGQLKPGLISRDNFGKIADLSLTAEKRSDLRSMLIDDSFVSMSGTKRRSPNLLKLLAEMNDFLVSLATKNDPQIDEIIESKFNDDVAKATKAYLNVLGYWGLGYSWYVVPDHCDNKTLIISRNDKPLMCCRISEINYVQGRPYRFHANLVGASISFDEKFGVLRNSWRISNNGETQVYTRDLLMNTAFIYPSSKKEG